MLVPLWQLSAQVSGYMGKRLIAKYDTYTNIYYPIFGKTPDNPFSMRHCAGLDYTVSRNVSVSTMFTFSEPIFIYLEETKGSLYNRGFAIGASVFSDEGLSPLGHFIKYELHYYKSSYSLYIEDAHYDVFGNYVFGKVNKKGDLSNVIMSFTMGQSAIVYDRLYINYGFQFGYRMGTLLGSILDIEDYSSESEIRIDVRKRNLLHNLWGVQFGIGYLIF